MIRTRGANAAYATGALVLVATVLNVVPASAATASAATRDAATPGAASPGPTWFNTSVAAREYSSMGYDASDNQMVVFGGQDLNFNVLGDTWTNNGATWTEQSPATSPPAAQRRLHGL